MAGYSAFKAAPKLTADREIPIKIRTLTAERLSRNLSYTGGRNFFSSNKTRLGISALIFRSTKNWNLDIFLLETENGQLVPPFAFVKDDDVDFSCRMHFKRVWRFGKEDGGTETPKAEQDMPETSGGTEQSSARTPTSQPSESGTTTPRPHQSGAPTPQDVEAAIEALQISQPVLYARETDTVPEPAADAVIAGPQREAADTADPSQPHLPTETHPATIPTAPDASRPPPISEKATPQPTEPSSWTRVQTHRQKKTVDFMIFSHYQATGPYPFISDSGGIGPPVDIPKPHLKHRWLSEQDVIDAHEADPQVLRTGWFMAVMQAFEEWNPERLERDAEREIVEDEEYERRAAERPELVWAEEDRVNEEARERSEWIHNRHRGDPWERPPGW